MRSLGRFCFLDRDAATPADCRYDGCSDLWAMMHTQRTTVTPALMPEEAHLIQILPGVGHSDGHEIMPLSFPAAGNMMEGSGASLQNPLAVMRGHASHRLFLARD